MYVYFNTTEFQFDVEFLSQYEITKEIFKLNFHLNKTQIFSEIITTTFNASSYFLPNFNFENRDSIDTQNSTNTKTIVRKSNSKNRRSLDINNTLPFSIVFFLFEHNFPQKNLFLSLAQIDLH